MQVRPKTAITAPPSGREPVPTATPKPATKPAKASRDVGARSITGSVLGVVAVAPLQHFAQLAKVVAVGTAADTDRDLADTGIGEPIGVLGDTLEHAPDPLNLVRVTADAGAVIGEDR